jgi:phosphocarrier protein FPr
LAKEVDFFSIGTNDLTQYTLAMDRGNSLLSARQDGLHPAVLRLIAKTIEGAHKHGKWAGICGELGSDPYAVPILIGLGIDELSVTVPSVPLVKAQVRDLKYSELQPLAQQALECSTAREVRELVKKTLSM